MILIDHTKAPDVRSVGMELTGGNALSSFGDLNWCDMKALRATWRNMVYRCTNVNTRGYRNYGGRGIRVCDLWMRSFESFACYIGPKPSSLHSVDRIDVNGHYEPGNVRWATPSEQASNQRPRVYGSSQSPITARQMQVLAFISDRSRDTGMSPSVREIAEHLFIASTNGVSEHLKALERKGCIRIRPHVPHGIILTEKAQRALREAA